MNFRKLRKFAKNAKALSPVIATIILIAVTVAVSVVVAAWMGGLTLGFMGSAEQASITNVVLTNVPAVVGPPAVAAQSQAVVTVQNTGSATVDISSATIDGNTGTIVAATVTSGTQVLTWTSGQVAIDKGNSVSITINVPAATEALVDSASYTIKLMTAKGNTITGSQTYSGP